MQRGRAETGTRVYACRGSIKSVFGSSGADCRCSPPRGPVSPIRRPGGRHPDRSRPGIEGPGQGPPCGGRPRPRLEGRLRWTMVVSPSRFPEIEGEPDFRPTPSPPRSRPDHRPRASHLEVPFASSPSPFRTSHSMGEVPPDSSTQRGADFGRSPNHRRVGVLQPEPPHRHRPRSPPSRTLRFSSKRSRPTPAPRRPAWIGSAIRKRLR